MNQETKGPEMEHRIAAGRPVRDPHLDKLVELLRRYDPEQIILFGSRARGQADAYSDYDVMVI